MTPPVPCLSEAVGNFPAIRSSSVVELPELLVLVGIEVFEEVPVEEMECVGTLARNEVYVRKTMTTKAMLPTSAMVLPRKSFSSC